METKQEVQSDKYLQENPETELEKIELKKTGSYIGRGIISYLILTVALMLPLQFIYRFFGLYDSNRNMSEFLYLDPASYFLMVSIVSILALFLPFFMILRNSKLKFTDVIRFQKLEGKSMWAWIAIGLAVAVSGNFIAYLLDISLESIGIVPELPSTPYANGFVNIALSIVSIAIIPAIMEEFVFRGVILGMLRKFGDGFSILVSASIFAIVHGNIIQSGFAFVVGIILGYIVVRTDISIRDAIFSIE